MKNIMTAGANFYDQSFVNATDVMLSEDKTSITILNTSKFYNYALYNSMTGLQATDWMNGSKGTIVFTNLDPKVKYAVRIQNVKDVDPKPIVNPQIIHVPSTPVEGAEIIIPAKKPIFNNINGCGMISIKTDPNFGYAILNEDNKPLTDKELKKWGVKVTNNQGYLVPKTDDGYFFGHKTDLNFEVPAGGEFKMGGKHLTKMYTFINGPTFDTPGLFYNAWYGYTPSYTAGKEGMYSLIINPACKFSVYNLYTNSGIFQTSKTVKGTSNVIFFNDVDPFDSYATGTPVPLMNTMTDELL